MIRKAVLFGALFLVLTLVTTAQVEAVGPPPTEDTYSVTFQGDFSSDDPTDMMVRRARGGKHLDLIGVLNPDIVTVENVPYWPGVTVANLKNLIISIDLKAGEVEMTLAFDVREECEPTKNGKFCAVFSHYQLRGSGGTYDGVSEVRFDEEAEFTLYDVILIPPKGKGTTGYGLDFVERPDELNLNFVVSIISQ